MAYSSQARVNMITNQLEPSGVSAVRLIAAMEAIPREKFVPEAFVEAAYIDEDIPLGHDRSLMEPRVFARLLQEVDIKKDDRVLDIACGTGYSAAIFSQLSDNVVAVESVGELAEVARKNLREMQSGVQLLCASIAGGHSLKAPYDLIFINGSVAEIPQEIFEQLAEGGRVIAIEASNITAQHGTAGVGQATCWTRVGADIHKQVLFEAATPLLEGFEAKAKFSF